MFAAMPNTAEVRKARAELLQMMEDKYNELIAEGQSENNAVGTVISEFGNLDELADDLGVKQELIEVQERESLAPRRTVTLDESKDFIFNRMRKAKYLAAGIMLCIISVAAPIFFGSKGHGSMGASLMFLLIALGVGGIVYSNLIGSPYRYLKDELCRIDMNTAAYIKKERHGFENIRAICVTIGIILCIVCWVPNVFLNHFRGGVSASLMFLLVGIGVFLIVYANSVGNGYEMLLDLNDVSVINGNGDNNMKPVRYINKTAETIVSVYWPTVTCLYLALSFLTFRWDITWIIWPIAGVAHRAVVINCQADDE